jgi:hypothetical protein
LNLQFAKNPPRSGDTVIIAWMVMGRLEFFFVEYRHGYIHIIKLALRMFPALKELATTKPTNQWERNIKLYLRNILHTPFRFLSLNPPPPPFNVLHSY